MKKPKNIAERGKDNVMPALVSRNEDSSVFGMAVRKMLGSGWGLSFSAMGDEIAAVATIIDHGGPCPVHGQSVLFGKGATPNEALASLVLEYYVRNQGVSED